MRRKEIIENWLDLISNMNGGVRDLRQAAPEVMKTFSDMARERGDHARSHA